MIALVPIISVAALFAPPPKINGNILPSGFNSVTGKYYDLSITGVREFMETELADKKSPATLYLRTRAPFLEIRDFFSRVAAISGLLPGVVFMYVGNDISRNENKSNEERKTGREMSLFGSTLALSGLLIWEIFRPSKAEVLNLLNTYNKKESENWLKLVEKSTHKNSQNFTPLLALNDKSFSLGFRINF